MKRNQSMYVSITKAKSKKGYRWKWDKGKSRALRNPKIIPAEPYTWSSIKNGNETVHHAEHAARLEGDPIVREPRPSYNLRVGESKRVDGKVKSIQKHLYSFSELDIIDEVMEQEGFGHEYQPGWCLDYEWLEKKVKEAFSDADMKALWLQIQDKMWIIEEPLIAEFKKSDEYRWWRKTLKLKNQMKAEQEQKHQEEQKAKEREQAEYQRKSRQQQSQYHQQFYGSGSAGISLPSAGLTLSGDEAAIIKKCYKSMAVQLHPDKGGTDADMALLNSLMDRIKAV